MSVAPFASALLTRSSTFAPSVSVTPRAAQYRRCSATGFDGIDSSMLSLNSARTLISGAESMVAAGGTAEISAIGICSTTCRMPMKFSHASGAASKRSVRYMSGHGTGKPEETTWSVVTSPARLSRSQEPTALSVEDASGPAKIDWNSRKPAKASSCRNAVPCSGVMSRLSATSRCFTVSSSTSRTLSIRAASSSGVMRMSIGSGETAVAMSWYPPTAGMNCMVAVRSASTCAAPSGLPKFVTVGSAPAPTSKVTSSRCTKLPATSTRTLMVDGPSCRAVHSKSARPSDLPSRPTVSVCGWAGVSKSLLTSVTETSRDFAASGIRSVVGAAAFAAALFSPKNTASVYGTATASGPS